MLKKILTIGKQVAKGLKTQESSCVYFNIDFMIKSYSSKLIFGIFIFLPHFINKLFNFFPFGIGEAESPHPDAFFFLPLLVGAVTFNFANPHH